MSVNRVLLTSSRMPFVLDEIRKFGKMGVTVFASDTFAAAPGSHSRYVEESLVTPPPRQQPEEFLDVLDEITKRYEIDLLVPGFEEVFYVARHLERLSAHTTVFASPFATLARLHDKVRFVELLEELGLPAPRTIVVESREDSGRRGP